MSEKHYKKFIKHLTEARKMRDFAVEGDDAGKIVLAVVDVIIDSCLNIYSLCPFLCGITAWRLRRWTIGLLRRENLLSDYRSLCNSNLKG